MIFARGEQLLFGHEIKMFAPEHLYSFGEQLLFAAEMLLLTQEMLYLRRKQLLPGREQLYLCAVHRLSRRGIFHSRSRIRAFYGEGFAETSRALSSRISLMQGFP